MKNIVVKEKMNQFLKLKNDILDRLRESKIEPKIRYDDTVEGEYGNSMSISYGFKNGGLKHWYLGIWGCGKWSNTYDCDSEDYISIFLIHKWHLDKFRPTSADILFIVNLKDPIEEQCEEAISEIVNINNHHILEYHRIFKESGHLHEDSHDMPCIEYFRDWLNNVVVSPFLENLSSKWSVIFLYWILRLISFIDPRVSRGKLFNEKDNFYPRYISGFLATEWASDREWAFNSFAWLYSKFPSKLCRLTRHRLFDAYWNVADVPEEITKKLNIRMWKGIIIKD